MTLDKGDLVSAVARVVPDDDEDGKDGDEESGDAGGGGEPTAPEGELDLNG